MAKAITFPNGRISIQLSDAEKVQAAITIRNIERGNRLWSDDFKLNAKDACRFIFTKIKTQEETTGMELAIEPKAYLRRLARRWFRCKRRGKTLFIHKSRRLIVSWFVRALELYAAGFTSAGFGIAAKHYAGMNGASSFVYRVYFMYDYLRRTYPEWNLDAPTHYGRLNAKELDVFGLPNGAKFYALNSDSEGVRGGGVSYIALEELSSYAEVDAVLGQAKMITQPPGGMTPGMVCCISNASENAQYKAQIKGEVPILPLSVPCFTYSSKTGSNVLVIHYKADPLKDDDWAAKTRLDVPARVWAREMELNDEIHDGEPVHPMFEDAVHVPASGKHQLFPLAPEAVLFGTWDCSTSTVNFAFVLKQIVETKSGEKQVQTLLEYESGGASNIHAFCKGLDAHLSRMYPKIERWRIRHEGDPAGSARSGSDPAGRTMFQIISSYGFAIRAAMTNNISDRLNAVDMIQSKRLSDGSPAWVVNAYGCPMLVEALRGAYCYKETKSAATGNVKVFREPAKNAFSHVADANQYGDLAANKLVFPELAKSKGSKGARFNGI